MPASVPESCTALATMVVKHGLEIKRRVDRLADVAKRAQLLDRASRARVVRSRSSLSSRAFSMAMTACLAKLLTRSICLSVNGRTSWR